MLSNSSRMCETGGLMLVELIVALQKLNLRQSTELESARKRIEELEKRLGGGPTAKLEEP